MLRGNIQINSSWPSVSAIIDFVALAISFYCNFWCHFYIFESSKVTSYNCHFTINNSCKIWISNPFIHLQSIVYSYTCSSDFDLLIQNFSWNHVSVLMNAIVVSLLLFCFLYNFYLQRKNRFTRIVIELTIGGECIFLPVLNLPFCPSFWKIVPPTDIFHIDVSTFPFALTMKFDWIGFNVTNISGTRTINVKSKVFSALKAKRITEQTYDVHILVSHHNVYQSLPHNGTYIVDTLTPKEHLPWFDLLFSMNVQDHNIFFSFLLHIHLELSRFLSR